MPVQPTDQCDQSSCPAFVQVSIQTRKRLLGFCAHHHDTNFAALVLAAATRIKHIGDLKPPVDRNSSSARTRNQTSASKNTNGRRLPGSQECLWASPVRTP
jgi:hypothetical protein